MDGGAKTYRNACATCDTIACCKHTFGAFWDAKSMRGIGCDHKVAKFDMASVAAVREVAVATPTTAPTQTQRPTPKTKRDIAAERIARMMAARCK